MSIRGKIAKLVRRPRAFLADARGLSHIRQQVSRLRSMAPWSATRSPAELFDLDCAARVPTGARRPYLYFPWAPEHDERLFREIDPEGELAYPLHFFKDITSAQQQKSIEALVVDHPDEYRRLLLSVLSPVRTRISGVVFTVDHEPVMRQLVFACRELSIPTVLLSLDPPSSWRGSYYCDDATGADLPACDAVLCGGSVQRDIFKARGYPAERIEVLGSDSTSTRDGQSGPRTRAWLERASQDPPKQLAPEHALARLFTDHSTSPSWITAAFHGPRHPSLAYLEAMLGFRRLLFEPDLASAQTADVFLKWGNTPTPSKMRQDGLASALGRPQLLVEDGFLRSVDIGLTNVPGLSITIDTETAYYDATRPSRLENRLNSTYDPSHAQRARARACIRQIREGRVSKYNHAPDRKSLYGDGPRLLLVDQRHGDRSVADGLADEQSFRRMVDAAIARAGHTIVVKRHPDSTKGGRPGYLGDELLKPYAASGRIIVVSDEINPHALFDQVEEVYVVTSGMGFEALMADRTVHCFGAPYYAGWGLTIDHMVMPRRHRPRSLEDVFHFAYIESSLYFDPEKGQAGEVESVIRYLASRRAR